MDESSHYHGSPVIGDLDADTANSNLWRWQCRKLCQNKQKCRARNAMCENSFLNFELENKLFENCIFHEDFSAGLF